MARVRLALVRGIFGSRDTRVDFVVDLEIGLGASPVGMVRLIRRATHASGLGLVLYDSEFGMLGRCGVG